MAERLAYWGRRVLRNAIFDLRYGSFLGGVERSKNRHLGANDTANSDYAALAWIFSGQVEAGDVLVDVGCGKGRVLNYWLENFPSNRLVGIELDAEIARSTARRLRRYRNVAVICADATKMEADCGTLLYLFNPFGAQQVASLEFRLRSWPRAPRVIYYNPVHLAAFENQFWRVDVATPPDHLRGAHRVAFVCRAVDNGG